ncbi:MAG: hypothetical protein JRF21_09010, partial [Deltaproteobacteria bacterium]|nr:hypothetical protein [Deltaproteobacteria bacterium]
MELKNQEMFESVAEWRLGAGLWLTLLAIFMGGLALNLTPCIYPLIPITVSYFGGRSVYLRACFYQLPVRSYSQHVRRAFRLCSTESRCSCFGGGNYGFICLELFWPLGTEAAFRPDQAGFKELQRILRDLLYGLDP